MQINQKRNALSCFRVEEEKVRWAAFWLPEVAGDKETARACGVDVGAGGEGAEGEVGGAALEEETAALESARGGELGGENTGLGGLDLLLGLRIKARGGKGRRDEAGESGFGGFRGGGR
jgi:hypothetical protein